MVIPPGPVTDSGPTAGLAFERGDLAVRVKCLPQNHRRESPPRSLSACIDRVIEVGSYAA
jgi:hypothetical protein